MLVLGRKTGESVIIEGLGRITVVRAHDGSCRLGFEFPKEVVIVREEVASHSQKGGVSGADSQR